MQPQSLLVTGGAGFIGSNLTEHLLERGYHVICIDDLCLGSEDNIKQFYKSKAFTFIKENINNKEKMEKSLNGRTFQCIIHCAGIVGVQYTQENPHKVLQDIVGLGHILECARDKNVSKVINLSSCEVYGETKNRKFSEKSAIQLNSLYAFVKRAGEELCGYYGKEYGIKTHSVRLFNAYGKKQRSDGYGFVVGRFIHNALQGKKLLVYADGIQTRDFTYVDDVVKVIGTLITRNDIAEPIINIGTGKRTRIIDLAKKVVALSNSKSEITFVEHKKDYITHRCADVRLQHQLIPTLQPCPLEDGLQKTISWHRHERLPHRSGVQ